MGWAAVGTWLVNNADKVIGAISTVVSAVTSSKEKKKRQAEAEAAAEDPTLNADAPVDSQAPVVAKHKTVTTEKEKDPNEKEREDLKKVLELASANDALKKDANLALENALIGGLNDNERQLLNTMKSQIIAANQNDCVIDNVESQNIGNIIQNLNRAAAASR